jgi:choline dehydrogenase
MDWQLKSTPQRFSSLALKNNQQFLPRGRGLGGSNQLNYLLHYTGTPSDFMGWNENWNYENLKPFLQRHGINVSGGNEMPKLSITSLKQTHSFLADAFIKSQRELNQNFDANVTFQLAQFTTQRGVRHSVYHEYLRRAFQNKNLDILMHSTAESIEFDANKEAISVHVTTQSSQGVRLRVRKEVILAAGAFHSPLILMRSNVTVDGAVGTNLFDHLNLPLFVSINVTASVTKDKILSAREIYRYLVDGSGVLSTTAVIGVGRKSDYGVILFGMGSADEKALKDVANFETEAFRAFFPRHANASQEGFVALSTCFKPRSRGSVTMKFNGRISIDPAYLSNEHDLKCMRNAIRLNVKMIETKAFQKLGAEIHWPRLRKCRNFGPFEDESSSDRYLDCIIKHGALTAHHPGGTCAIDSVVDKDLKVIGVKKVRVVDASILPTPVAGFPNSIIIAIAEFASRIILRQSSGN